MLTRVRTDWGEQVLNTPGWSRKEPACQWFRNELGKEDSVPLAKPLKASWIARKSLYSSYCARAFGNPLSEVQNLRAWSPETWAAVFAAVLTNSVTSGWPLNLSGPQIPFP